MQIKIFCDKCRKEIAEGGELSIEIGSMFGVSRGKVYKSGHLCDPCAREVVKFIFKEK